MDYGLFAGRMDDRDSCVRIGLSVCMVWIYNIILKWSNIERVILTGFETLFPLSVSSLFFVGNAEYFDFIVRIHDKVWNEKNVIHYNYKNDEQKKYSKYIRSSTKVVTLLFSNHRAWWIPGGTRESTCYMLKWIANTSVLQCICYHLIITWWRHQMETFPRCHLCGEFTGDRWIPHTKSSDAELWCLLWSAPE